MKTSQINIRFTPQIEADLNVTAEKLGLNKSALVRKITEVFLAEVKRSGTLHLDHTWIESITSADARTSWGKRKPGKED